MLAGGICCGICLTIGSMAQQIGLQYTTAGKRRIYYSSLYSDCSTFGTGIREKSREKKVWCGVILAVVGMYFLCVKDGFSISKGDWIIFGRFFRFCGTHSCDRLFFAESGWSMSFVSSVFYLRDDLCHSDAGVRTADSECGTGILATDRICRCIVQWRRIYASDHCTKNTDPTVASLLMSLESVFAVLAGWVILGERLSVREFVGCVLVFLAVIIAQIQERKAVSSGNRTVSE